MSQDTERLSDKDVAERTEADGHIGLSEALLAREVQEWRALAVAEKCVNGDHHREIQASRKLVADLRALHGKQRGNDDGSGPWCDQDGFTWPCPTIRMIDEGGL